jgi:fructokinase
MYLVGAKSTGGENQHRVSNKQHRITMPEIITCGELLIDFVPTVSGVSLLEAPAFKKAPGGAPANVAVGVSRLGVSCGFIGKVGDDPFGHFLAKTLEDSGVDIRGLQFSSEARTALAFVSLLENGERDFMFYRHPSADMLFRPEEVDDDYIRSAKIFHFGSISLIQEPSRSATLHAVDVASQAGLIISYDPNLRLNLWPNEEKARQDLLLGWSKANIIKASEEELQFLSGSTDFLEGGQRLWHSHLNVLIVTRGREGCTYLTQAFYGFVPGFSVIPIDTTGAGDGFVAGLLVSLVRQPQAWKEEAELQRVCKYANAVGALTTTQRGAIPALPTAEQVEAFIRLGQ